MKLDAAAAKDGIECKCGDPMGLDAVAAANGIVEIANAAMINALRLVSVRRGYDPRDLAMVVSGGAAPLHANRLMDEMQFPLLIIPPSPGTKSALGLLVTDLRHEFSHTHVTKASGADAAVISRLFDSMAADGRRTLTREGMPAERMSFQREIEARYTGQSHEMPVACAEGALTEGSLRDVVARFHKEHERAYGHAYSEEEVEFVTFRVTAIGSIDKPKLRVLEESGYDVHQARREVRPVFFAEEKSFQETPIYDRYRLSPGHRLEGPAIVEELDSTSLIHPGFQAAVDLYGNLLVTNRT